MSSSPGGCRMNLSPDPVYRGCGAVAGPKNALNDMSTMNKSMEYMAFELPVVAFDLWETRVSTGDAAVYVKPNDVREYAEAIVELIDDKPKRARMGSLGRARVEQELAWRHQEHAYVGFTSLDHRHQGPVKLGSVTGEGTR